MVVEDDADVRRLAREVLEPYGYGVLEAENSHDALELLERHATSVHLILAHVVMPGIGGRKLSQYVAQLRPETKILHVGISGGDERPRHARRRTVLRGQVFHPRALAAKVRRALDSKPAGSKPAAPEEPKS